MEIHVADMSLKMQKKKNSPANTQTRKKKKKREGIKSPVLSLLNLESQLVTFNIYMKCLSCVDDNFNWDTRGGRGRLTLTDSTAGFEFVSSSSLLLWFRWQQAHSMDEKYSIDEK